MKLVKVIVTFTLELIYFFCTEQHRKPSHQYYLPSCVLLGRHILEKNVVSRLSLFPVRSCYFLRFAF